jgi:hypothetical protein
MKKLLQNLAIYLIQKFLNDLKVPDESISKSNRLLRKK